MPQVGSSLRTVKGPAYDSDRLRNLVEERAIGWSADGHLPIHFGFTSLEAHNFLLSFP
jgi:hypothetical protein